MTPDAAREYAVSVWAFGILAGRDDDLGEWDMALATLQAVRERVDTA
ncbi:hypothetical protein [Streptomyces sp. NPDC055134]